MLSGSILQKLRDAHRGNAEARSELNFGVYYKNTLVALCHALEDSILTVDSSPLVITAFQQGKWYLQEADRYGEIAQESNQIVIMAAPDTGFHGHPTSGRSNVDLVDLDEADPVSQEWHLIILSPSYTAMVLCQELTDADYEALGKPTTDLERKFYGFWTFEPSLVLETARLAVDHIHQYDAALYQALTNQVDQTEQAISDDHVAQPQPTAVHLSDIVQRVITYLQTAEQGESAPVAASAVQPTHTELLANNLMSNKLQAFLRLAQIMDQADMSNPMAAAEVAALCEAIGQLLDLPGWQLHRLRLAGLLHRLAFLQNIDDLPPVAETKAEGTDTAGLFCPLNPGMQVLRTMPRLRAIATIITHQTEWWNGSGLPARLQGDRIPLESRILALASSFQQQLAKQQVVPKGDRFGRNLDPDALGNALAHCAADAGDRWDPKLVEVLTLLVSGLKQGLSLSVSMPKIASGLWLLNDEVNLAEPSLTVR
ncbi:MAG: DICT sensory domain-containing protein [Cyanobacteria bacterium P01_A01_bin.135]